MKNTHIIAPPAPKPSLQTGEVCCKLQTTCKLESNKNKGLGQFAVCRPQFADTPCKLTTNSVTTGVTEAIPVCTQTPSLYERGESPGGETPHLGEQASQYRGLPGVLCLDLGTTTGWAIHSRQRVITSGSISFKNNRWEGGGMRFLKFNRFLGELSENTAPIQMIFFEEVRRHLGVDAAHAYGGFLAHLSAWCEFRNIPYTGVPVGTIKKFITGKGNASKQQVIAAVEALGYHPADDNEADALALMHWALDHLSVGGTA